MRYPELDELAKDLRAAAKRQIDKAKMIKVFVHPFKGAIDEFKKSDSYKTKVDHKSLGLEWKNQMYLANRIERAFEEGFEAAKKIYCPEIK